MKKIICLLICIICLTGCSNEEKEIKTDTNSNIKTENKVEEKNDVTVNIENDILEDIPHTEKEPDKVVENNKVTSSNKNTNSNSNSNNNTVTTPEVVTYTNNDKEAISAFNEIENNVDSLLKSGSNESIKDKAKGVFITIVDFIFYDGEINGVTFSELTSAGKEKVLSIAASIDAKIENKFPGYKETISDTTTKAFKKASELIKIGANNINNFAREKLGEEHYNEIIASKDELVAYTKNALSILGDVGSNLFNKGKDALSNWYQNFKNNN